MKCKIFKTLKWLDKNTKLVRIVCSFMARWVSICCCSFSGLVHRSSFTFFVVAVIVWPSLLWCWFYSGRNTVYGRTFNKIDYLNNNHLMILYIGSNKATRIVYVVLKCLTVYNIAAIRILYLDFCFVENGRITAAKINSTSEDAQHSVHCVHRERRGKKT